AAAPSSISSVDSLIFARNSFKDAWRRRPFRAHCAAFSITQRAKSRSLAEESSSMETRASAMSFLSARTLGQLRLRVLSSQTIEATLGSESKYERLGMISEAQMRKRAR